MDKETSDPIAERLEASATLVKEISNSNFAKMSATSIGAVFLYALWENRTNVLVAIMSSPTIALTLLAAAIALGIGWLFAAVLAKVERAQTQLLNMQQGRIQQLEEQVETDHKLMLDALARLERVENKE